MPLVFPFRLRHLPTVAVAAAAVACSAGDRGGTEELGVVRSAVVRGYVDEDTTGVVGIGVELSPGFFTGHCSGSLIAPNLVLTARHCVALTSAGLDNRVVCGETTFATTGVGSMFLVSPETTRPEVPNHPSFYRGREVRVAPGGDEVCGFDVALIVLDQSIPSDIAKPLIPRIDESPQNAETFSAAGYGLTEPQGSLLGVRMRSDGHLVSCLEAGCLGFFGLGARDHEWASRNAGICSGDSGGPAIDQRGRVIGVASRSTDQCGDAVYGDVAAWRDFILRGARDAAELGRYAPAFWLSGISAPPDEVVTVAASVFAGTAGTECDLPGECADGLICHDVGDAGRGRCREPCDDGDAACPAGKRCDSTVGICVGPDQSPTGAADPTLEPQCAAAHPSDSQGSMLLTAVLVWAALVRRTRPGVAESSRLV